MDRAEIMKKILLAAIECVEENGMDGVSMRKIAQKAEINSAMLHYYYGSKENLMVAVSQATIEEGLKTNLRDYQDKWKTQTNEAFRGLLYDTLTGMLRYPNITKSHFYDVMVNNSYDSVPINALKNFFEELYALVSSIIAGNNDQEKRYAFRQLLSIVLMTGLMPGVFTGDFDLNLSDEYARRLFIEGLIKRFTIKDSD
jgi:AcrR family transcriptional regulator